MQIGLRTSLHVGAKHRWSGRSPARCGLRKGLCRPRCRRRQHPASGTRQAHRAAPAGRRGCHPGARPPGAQPAIPSGDPRHTQGKGCRHPLPARTIDRHHHRERRAGASDLRGDRGVRATRRIRERIHAGLDHARRNGKSLGRPKALDDEKAAAVVRLRGQGTTIGELSRTFGISKPTVRKYLAG